jgi:tetratricopeptide (TPR) repeat protein
MEDHLSEDLCGRFLRSAASEEDSQRVVRHLLAGCPRCTEIIHRLAVESGRWPEGRPTRWEDYEEALQRAFAFVQEEEKRIVLEKLRGWAQWAAIEPLPSSERTIVVASDSSYHTFGFYDRLLEASRLAMRLEPAEAVDIVQLALLVAERLDPERHGREGIADLRAVTWAELANVRRLASDLQGAHRALSEALRIFEAEGSRNPLIRARITSLEASYLNDLEEFESAERILGQVLRTYRQAGDTHLQGRTLLEMGNAIGHVDARRGVRHIRKALTLLDPGREPRLQFCALHGCAWLLNDSGEPEEALNILNQARPLYEQFPDAYTQIRLHWLEARIALNLGALAEAESTFQQLWEELRARHLGHALLLVSLDLAETFGRKGEPARAAELIRGCYLLLLAWGFRKEALAAWLVLQQALAHR